MRTDLTPLSYSSLKEFLKSPAHFLTYKNKETKESPAMRLGTAAHAAILEPQKFDAEYDTTDLRRNTKAYKELPQDKIYLSQSEWKSVVNMKANVMSNLSASDELHHCDRFETKVQGEIDGVEFRGFVDAMNDDTIIDLKTTQDASPEGFRKSLGNYSYHLQAAIYLKLTGAKRYFIIAVESSPPYNTCVYELSEDTLEAGNALLKKGISKFKEWDGSWYGYEPYNYTKLDLPNWMK